MSADDHLIDIEPGEALDQYLAHRESEVSDSTL